MNLLGTITDFHVVTPTCIIILAGPVSCHLPQFHPPVACPGIHWMRSEQCWKAEWPMDDAGMVLGKNQPHKKWRELNMSGCWRIENRDGLVTDVNSCFHKFQQSSQVKKRFLASQKSRYRSKSLRLKMRSRHLKRFTWILGLMVITIHEQIRWQEMLIQFFGCNTRQECRRSLSCLRRPGMETSKGQAVFQPPQIPRGHDAFTFRLTTNMNQIVPLT